MEVASSSTFVHAGHKWVLLSSHVRQSLADVRIGRFSLLVSLSSNFLHYFKYVPPIAIIHDYVVSVIVFENVVMP